ncbi:MAG: hypothetical protein PHU21_12280, partial [Elusimicrobia bacterium]|nr:hypothetical protein [Elusimicrobiota bacterium]
DHALVNLSLAEAFGRRAAVALVDRGLAVLMGPGSCRLGLKKGELLSLLAAGAGARLSLRGVRYPLKRARLAPGGRGLSNTARGAVCLTVHSGRVWVMTPGPAGF